MKENYFMYLRKSRADWEAEKHGEGETLKRHESILSSLANRQGLHISGIYREIVSGESIEKRPQMMKLLRDMEQEGCSGVLVMEIERLARGDPIDQGIVARAFRYSGAKIITPTKTYDPENEFDEEYFEFGLFMSRREYKTIVRRMNLGRISAVKEGRFAASTAPYGYQRIKIPDDRGFTLIPNPEEAPAVRLIYDLYTEGRTGETYGLRKIAQYLDQLNLTPRKSDHWSPSSVRGILTNETYLGKLVWQKRREVKQMKNGIAVKCRPRSESYLCADGLHEPIVSYEQFQKAGLRLASRSNPASPAPHVLKNPLAGLVYCECCGSLMVRLPPGNKMPCAVLRCPNSTCRNISSPLHLIEEALLFAIQNWFVGYALTVPPCAGKTNPPEWNSLREIQEAQKACQKQISKACQFLETGLYGPALFSQRMETLKGQLGALRQEEIQISKKQRGEKTDPSPKVGSCQTLLDIYYEAPSISLKNELLKSLLRQVRYKKCTRSKKGKQDEGNFTLSIQSKFPAIIPDSPKL